MPMKYVHTNLIAKDWRRLSAFYQEVFGCVPVPPERDLSGEWVDKATGISGAHIFGMHLRLPGYGDAGPTLEAFRDNIDAVRRSRLLPVTLDEVDPVPDNPAGGVRWLVGNRRFGGFRAILATFDGEADFVASEEQAVYDTLRAEAEVVDLRPTKNPERFLFIYRNKGFNQRDQQVIEYQTTMMVTRMA